MKTLKNGMYLLLVVLVTTFTACSTDDGEDSGDTAAAGRMTAKIDGDNFQSMEIATTATVVAVGGAESITLQGGDSDGRTILFIINGFDGVGDYTIDSESLVLSTASYIVPNISNPQATQSWSAPFMDSGMIGNVDINVFSDAKVEGTFSVTVQNADGGQVAITNGAFNINR